MCIGRLAQGLARITDRRVTKTKSGIITPFYTVNFKNKVYL